MPDRSFPWIGLGLILALLGGTGGSVAAQDAEALSARFRQASKQALPAVVTVRSSTGAAGGDVLARSSRDGGSGVVVDSARGLVVTNDHVVAGASRGVVVILANGRERPVAQVWRDPKSDLALLAIDPADLVAAPWGDDRRLDIGDWVLAIGGPFGLSGTVTAGIISGKSRGIGMALYEDLIQTDAAINPGNSGGPLINLQGEVVGINTALKSTGGGYDGVGFAIPAGRARRVVAELAEFGRVRRAYLGVTTRPVDALTASRLNIADGAVISSVVVGGPASAAGLQPGDVILTVGGQPAGGQGALQAAVEVAAVGAPLDLTVDRNGQVFPVQVRPEAQPDGYGLPAATANVVGGPIPTQTVVPVRPRGLHINVPGFNMIVPGPNLNITPNGVSRAPRVLVPPPTYETTVPAPGQVVPGPAATTTPTPAPVVEPELRPLDPVPDNIPAPATTSAPGDVPPPVPVPPPVEASSRPGSFPALGLNVAEPTPALADRYHLPRDASGLVVTSVVPDGPADRGGLEPGMMVTDAAGKQVGNLADFRQTVESRPAGRDLLVRIRRGTKSEFRVVVAPPAEAPTPAPAPAPAPTEGPTLEPLPPPATPRPL